MYIYIILRVVHPSIHIYLYEYFIHPAVYLSIYLYIDTYLSFYPFIYLSVSIYIAIYLSVYILYIYYLSIYPSTILSTISRDGWPSTRLTTTTPRSSGWWSLSAKTLTSKLDLIVFFLRKYYLFFFKFFNIVNFYE